MPNNIPPFLVLCTYINCGQFNHIPISPEYLMKAQLLITNQGYVLDRLKIEYIDISQSYTNIVVKECFSKENEPYT